MKKLTIILSILFLQASLTSNSQASSGNGFGLAAGGSVNIIDNIFTPESTSLVLEDHIFVGAEAFANYYKGGIVNYNYGFKGNLGYSINGFEAYGFAGVHDVGLNSNNSAEFKDDKSSLYGYGIGYDFPFVKVRLETSYFELERRVGKKEQFVLSGVSLMFGF